MSGTDGMASSMTVCIVHKRTVSSCSSPSVVTFFFLPVKRVVSMFFSPARPSRAETPLSPSTRSELFYIVRDAIGAHDLCRGSGTVLLSRGGRAARRRALFDGPFCDARTDGVAQPSRGEALYGRTEAPECALSHSKQPTPGGVRGRTIIEDRTRARPSKLACFLLKRGGWVAFRDVHIACLFRRSSLVPPS